ncbi:MAG: hypothetical protein ACLRNQ_10025 [Flavonifractor plautii]
MDTIEIARRLAELGQTGEAQAAYTLALQEAAERNPELELEAASYLFFLGELSGGLYLLCLPL